MLCLLLSCRLGLNVCVNCVICTVLSAQCSVASLAPRTTAGTILTKIASGLFTQPRLEVPRLAQRSKNRLTRQPTSKNRCVKHNGCIGLHRSIETQLWFESLMSWVCNTTCSTILFAICMNYESNTGVYRYVMARGQHDSGYPALMGAPDNITVTVTTARHYYELFSA